MNNDLISRSALLRETALITEHFSDEIDAITIEHAIRTAPAVDAEPVQHGEWILNPCNLYNDATWVCSVCGNEWVLIDGTPLDNQMNYCPKCGARMDGGTKANG